LAKILIVGNPQSPLVRARGLVGQHAGHQIFWFSAYPINLAGVNSLTLPQFARYSFLLRAFLEPLYLSRVLKEVNPDIVHVHYASKGLAALPLARRHPLMVTAMGSDILPEVGYKLPYSPFTRKLLNAADLITSKSNFMDDALLEVGDYAPKIRRITWGIDLRHFQPKRDVRPLRIKWQIPEKNIVFFDPRSATPFYNKHLTLKAFAGYLASGGLKATLLVAELGAKPGYVEELKDLSIQLGIKDQLRFIGTVKHEEMADYYALSDITISIPPSDGLPQSIYEALACGSFLIMNDLPAYQEVVEDGVTAKLVPPGNIGALEAAMLWVTEHREVRQKAKGLGRKYVEKYADQAEQTKRVNQLYAELLEAKTHA